MLASLSMYMVKYCFITKESNHDEANRRLYVQRKDFQGPKFSKLCTVTIMKKAKKRIETSKRKVNKVWGQKLWLKRKLTVIQRREKAEGNTQNG